MFISVPRYIAFLFAVALVSSCGARPSSPSVRKNSVQLGSPANIGAGAGYARVMASSTIEGQALPEDDRPVAMVFFASWCGHCRNELAQLDNLRKRYPTLRIIGLNAYEEFRDYSDKERLRTFIAENAPWLTEIVSADEDMRATFGKVPKIPSLFLYNKHGAVVAEFRRDKGPPPTEQELEEAIVRALEGSASL